MHTEPHSKTKSLDRPRPVGQESKLITAAITLVLAAGVVGWQHLLHATLLVRSDDAWSAHLPHLMRDIALAIPLATVAVVSGRNISSLVDRSGRPWPRAALTSLIFSMTMLIGVPIHGKIDAAFGGHVETGPWLSHAIRDALVGQLVAFPLLVLAIYACTNPAEVLTRRMVVRAAAVTTAVCALAIAGAGGIVVVASGTILVMLVSVERPTATRIALAGALMAGSLALPGPIGLSDPSPAAAAVDADGCEVGANVRTYDVAAINVDMVLNRFGDHDPTAMMYVLENRIADVRAQEASGEVTPGLRKDPIQALVIRANVGECLEINFRNDLAIDASMNVIGLPYTAANGAGFVGLNPDTLAAPGATLTYRFSIPSDPAVEGAYTFHSMNDPRQTMAHGLFGTLVIEPAGSIYLDPEDSSVQIESGWEAIIVDPRGVDFREFVINMHEVGDEIFEVLDANDNPLPLVDDITGSYRPASRALNYRSEPFRNRLGLGADKSLAYSSYTFGDPATPIPRSYLGEPTKTRLTHPGSEMFHVYHLHGGGDRWPRNPGASTSNFASGLDKQQPADVQSTHLDSQAVGPGETFNLEHACGAGGCQQAAGDFLFHCHIGPHYVSGMWSFWRVFDTQQADLAVMPPDAGYLPPPVAAAGNSIDLIGTVIDGQTLVPAIDADLPSELAIEDYVASLLPPQGVRIDDQDATVWDWTIEYVGGDPRQPLVLGEPDDTTVWPNYESPTPGVRPEVQFNLSNGRYAWPLFRPHLNQRPPFSPNGHSGTPWLGSDVTGTRPDGLCPTDTQVPGRRILDYPVTAIDVPIPITDAVTDPLGMLYALSEDVDEIRAGTQTAEPLVLRSNVGDCIDVILTSEQEDVNHGDFAKVNMHTHFVQFDPQASDGVITGMSYEQSVRPYESENRTLTAAAGVGDTVIAVTNTDRLRVGISIGVGLGEGMCDPATGAPVADPDNADRACTEIRNIVALTPTSITLDAPLQNDHALGEAVGVEFVQYRWYSDTEAGTVFFHDHVDFNNWFHGLFAAHIIEPAGSTWHDPQTGAEVRTGTVADIHAPASASVGVGQSGSFREFMVFLHNGANVVDGLNEFAFATINMRSAPLPDRDPDFPFSSVTNDDPATPVFRAYVGDDVVVRNLGVVERVGALRVTGHRYLEDRWDPNSAVEETSSVGISAREDLVLIDGAGGSAGLPGDYLYYSTKAQDTDMGAWGIIRVHDREEPDLMPLPDVAAPPSGNGFPNQTFTGLAPDVANNPGDVCPGDAPIRTYDITAFTPPLAAGEVATTAFALTSDVIDILNGVKPLEPLVLRVEEGECLEITVNNNANHRVVFNVGELTSDVQQSSGMAVGFNEDSSIPIFGSQDFQYYADSADVGMAMIYDLSNIELVLLAGGFGAIIVEPAGSTWLDTSTATPIETGLEAIIVRADGSSFREFVALFQDADDKIGSSSMPYPEFVRQPAAINYATDPLRDGGRMDLAATELAFSTAEHGDPANLFEAYVGDEVVFRLGMAAGMQAHVFGVGGHLFPWDNDITGSDLLAAKGLLPGETFDLVLHNGAGGGVESGADYLFGDYRMPFLEGGMWGILRTHDTVQAGLAELPKPALGQLRLTTTPALPTQIVIDGEPRQRWGLDWMGIEPGEHEVCYTDIIGWITPACDTVTVTSGQITTHDVNFQQAGNLRVITNPPVPSTISINGVAVDDWGYWSDVAPGDYEVCFGNVAGMDAPACETRTVNAGDAEVVTGDFSANPAAPGPGPHGLLRVTSNPPVPTQIYIDGEPVNQWGISWMKAEPGWHEVCFGDVIDFDTPNCQTVLVEVGQTTFVEGMFQHRGWLRVVTDLPHDSVIYANGVPRNNWGMWVDLPLGTYEVCFGESDGFTPPCETVAVADGVTTLVTGTWP